LFGGLSPPKPLRGDGTEALPAGFVYFSIYADTTVAVRILAIFCLWGR